ncbi:MAG: type VI-B CRISPR-associated RNA-guided ribonuclease Cas13b [Planctomycetaceae bacterium]|jgi:hypothetical protein|nr:type VI-B CRISPR-associated RNA-guided ribonuclease Cas13b [Planctomycetaceae bacterium]
MKNQISFDKPFWSMHLNMAANNLLAVVQYLDRKYANDHSSKTQETAETLENETTDHGFEDGGINNVKKLSIFDALKKTDKETNKEDNEETNIVLQSKIINDLVHYFPFLREIKNYREAAHEGKDKNTKQKKNIPPSQLLPKDIADLFLFYAQLLYKKRNEYTHALHDKELFSENNQKQLFDLDRLVEFNRRTIKERFYKTIDNKTADKLLMPLTAKIVGAKKTKDMKNNPDYLCKQGFFNEDKTDFSPAGLAFFVAQFLEPKYISELVQGLKFPKEYEQLLIRAFSVTHIILPRTRLMTDSELSPQTVGMDILNELHKCPDELFNMLSPERQNDFRFIDEETQTENLMKRFGKYRAETLMLRYLDVNRKFDQLRFHICTGTFFNADYQKTMFDGSVLEHRRLSKRIFCFDNMQDVLKRYTGERESYDNAKKEKQEYETWYWFPQAGQSPKKTEYRTDMIPQYVIGRQGIGLALKTKGEPSFATRGGKYNRIQFKNPTPDAWLSPYELPVITFLTAHGKADAVEKVINDFCTNWNALRQAIADRKNITKNDVAAVYHLRFDDLPENIRQYIGMGNVKISPVDQTEKEAKTALSKMIADTQRKLGNFRKEQEVIYKQGGFKQGKKSKQPQFKTGSMALFIARDVVKLQKPDETDAAGHKGKITSANFQILQRSLALFDCRKDTLKQIFNKAGLTKNPKFVEKVLASGMTSIDCFYEKYLEGKICFLNEYLENPQDCYVLRRRFARNKKKCEVGYITKWAKARAENADPVNLPRGLFTGILTDLIKEKFPKQFNALPIRKRQNNGEKFILPHNTTFLIQKFHEWNGDGSQWFYSVERDAMSKTLKRLTSFLSPEKSRTSNPINGITEELQQELYKQWLAEPNLTTLFLIDKTLPLKAKTQETVDPAQLRMQAIKEQLQNPATPRFKQENLRMELTELSKRKPAKKEKPKLLDVKDADKFNRIFSAFTALEATLRHNRMQDIVLFDAMRELLGMKTVKGNYLKDIDAPKKFLLSETNKLLSWKYRVGEKEYTITGKMKPKNFGNFRRVINDVRLPSLLCSLAEISQKSEFDYDDIEKEFADYDRGRREVFGKIHELENAVIKKYRLQAPTEGEGKGFIGFSKIVKSLPIPEAEKRVLVVYRNSFAHHKYPNFTYELDEKEKESAESIAEGEKRFAKEREAVISCSLSNTSLTKHIINCFEATFDKACAAV